MTNAIGSARCSALVRDLSGSDRIAREIECLQVEVDRARLAREQESAAEWSDALWRLVTALGVLVGFVVTYRRMRATERQVDVAQQSIDRQAEQANRQAQEALENLRLARDGQITERFSRAIEHLGSEGLAVRIGGIYALERIHRDSPRDRWSIIETLCAFAVAKSNSTNSDIHAAMKVIGRRIGIEDETESLALSNVDVSWMDLTGANLSGAEMSGAQMMRATLVEADLSEAQLDGVMMHGASLALARLPLADLRGANLREATLAGANLREATLRCAHLEGANLHGADLSDADLTDADLRGTRDLTLAQLESAASYEGAKLPPELERELAERKAAREAAAGRPPAAESASPEPDAVAPPEAPAEAAPVSPTPDGGTGGKARDEE